MDGDILRWVSQWPRLIHIFTMLIMLLRHLSSLTTALRCFQKMWSGLGIDKLLHLLIVILNSSLEKKDYVMIGFNKSLSKKSRLICQFYTELNF